VPRGLTDEQVVCLADIGAKLYSPAMIVAIDPVEARRNWAIAFDASAGVLSDVRCSQVVGHPDVGFDVCPGA
jgi:hypothetical protein